MPKLTLSFKGRLIDVFHLGEGETLIGRDEDCQINIDSLAIAPFHARIRVQGEGCSIGALHEAFPIAINHNQTASTALRHGDVIQVGKHTLTYSEDAIEPAGELQPTPQDTVDTETETLEAQTPLIKGVLQIMNGDNFGRIIPLTRNMTRIGRVGGECAMIARRETGYYISYLEGVKSPLVNSKPIGDASLLLNDGDLIEVGPTRMQFHI